MFISKLVRFLSALFVIFVAFSLQGCNPEPQPRKKIIVRIPIKEPNDSEADKTNNDYYDYDSDQAVSADTPDLELSPIFQDKINYEAQDPETDWEIMSDENEGSNIDDGVRIDEIKL